MAEEVENMDNGESQTPDAEQAEQTENFLSMSDEDFLKTAEPEENIQSGDDTDEEESSDEVTGHDDAGAMEPEEDDETLEEEESLDDQPNDDNDSETPEEGNDEEEPELDTENEEIDYKAAYEQLLQPLKSSGRTINIRDINHARTYMQFGENYHRKMHEIKPYLKTVRTLKKHGLIGAPDETDRINFLLDLDQRKPEAVKKLIAEAGIDPYELQDEDKYSPEKAKEYQPEDHMVSETDIEIEDALKEISSSEQFDRTVHVLTNEFDDKSKDIIAENPEYIKYLNADMESGQYDKIMDEVRYQRDMNMMPGSISDIEAYIGVVQQMIAQRQQQAQNQQQNVDQSDNSGRQRVNRKVDKKRKQSMSSTKTSRKKQGNKEFDFLSMSDEEFEKLGNLPV